MYVNKNINPYTTNSQVHTYNTSGKINLHTFPRSNSLYNKSYIHTGLQLIIFYLVILRKCLFQNSNIQAIQHKNSFYSVNEIKEYFQNKGEAKKKTKSVCMCKCFNYFVVLILITQGYLEN